MEEGAEEYIPEIQINELGDTKLRMELEGTELHVFVDGEDVTGAIEVSVSGAGSVGLGAGWGGWGYSQRNVADDVYDGVFKNLTVTEGETLHYDNRLHGIEKVTDRTKTVWNTVLNWFITHL